MNELLLHICIFCRQNFIQHIKSSRTHIRTCKIFYKKGLTNYDLHKYKKLKYISLYKIQMSQYETIIMSSLADDLQ